MDLTDLTFSSDEEEEEEQQEQEQEIELENGACYTAAAALFLPA
jgi:hypothetical protein